MGTSLIEKKIYGLKYELKKKFEFINKLKNEADNTKKLLKHAETELHMLRLYNINDVLEKKKGQKIYINDD